MPSAKDYLERIEQILGGNFAGGKLSVSFHWNTPAEAKELLSKIRLMKKELLLVKKEINATKRAIRSQFMAKKAEVGTGFGAGLSTVLFGTKARGRTNALEKENLRRSQVVELSPYEEVTRAIDDLLLKLDKAKPELESVIKSI